MGALRWVASPVVARGSSIRPEGSQDAAMLCTPCSLQALCDQGGACTSGCVCPANTPVCDTLAGVCKVRCKLMEQRRAQSAALLLQGYCRPTQEPHTVSRV